VVSSFFFFFFFFSSPNLSGRRLDVYHTSTHGVAVAEILNAGLKCAARRSLEIQDAKKLPKKLLSSNMFSRCPNSMVNFSPVAAEIFSLAWGTPANFNGFCILAVLLHGILVVGVSQTLRR